MPTRRVFLRNSGLALLSLGVAPSFLTRTVQAAGGRRKILIAVFQRGAVDGLNMVIPYGERDYYRVRPTIAIERPRNGSDAAVDLDGFFGLHPRMAPLEPFFARRELAVVHACGSHDSTRSHFDAQDYMESGTPGRKGTRDGWLNRYLQGRDHEHATTFQAVALAGQLPRMLQGAAPVVAMPDISRFGLRAGAATNGLRDAFEAEYAAAADRVLGGTGRDAFDAIELLEAADPTRYAPDHGAEYPRSPFGEALKQIGQLIKADVGLEVAFTESGNWDHHVNEGGTTGLLAGRLDDLARGLSALATDLGDRMADVLVLTMSEFSRAVAENGNRGTDHGHGNAMLVLGGGVRGGQVYGVWPGLDRDDRFEGRDLAVTTDFRDVFGEVLVRHLGVEDTRPVFPGYQIRESSFTGFLSSPW